jgi:hypothetical protein
MDQLGACDYLTGEWAYGEGLLAPDILTNHYPSLWVVDAVSRFAEIARYILSPLGA